MWLFTIVVEWSGNQRHHKLEWYIIPLDFFPSSPYRKTFLISEDIVHLEGLKNVDLFEKKVRMIYIAQDSYFWFSTEMFFFFKSPGKFHGKAQKEATENCHVIHVKNRANFLSKVSNEVRYICSLYSQSLNEDCLSVSYWLYNSFFNQ